MSSASSQPRPLVEFRQLVESDEVGHKQLRCVAVLTLPGELPVLVENRAAYSLELGREDRYVQYVRHRVVMDMMHLIAQKVYSIE